MKLIKFIFIIVLSIYSLTLIYLEFQFGQDYVRLYFTDISGPIQFYAINTTLSTFLLWACALIFAINLSLINIDKKRNKDRIFYGSQILVFIYLGGDERFKFHEWLGNKFDINDAFILLGIGLIEIGLIYFYGDLKKWSKRIKLYLYSASIFFALMIIIDMFLPSQLLLRLTFEDLSKTWAAFFLFMFAWEICQSNINKLKQPKEILS